MISHAQVSDIPKIIDLMVEFANAAPIADYHKPEPDPHRLGVLIGNFMRAGVVLVARADDQISGVFIAQIVGDIWLPEIRHLREVAWYVKPEYRNTSAGYRLLAEFTSVGKRLLESKLVNTVVLTTMVNSPDLKLTNRGWREIETNYIYEGVA